MSAGPREQTAAILREHSGTFVDQEGDTRCECGKWLEPGEHEWDWHVAGLVVEALGLTEEWVARRTEQVNDGPIVELGPVRRWVSGWSVVGGEQ